MTCRICNGTMLAGFAHLCPLCGDRVRLYRLIHNAPLVPWPMQQLRRLALATPGFAGDLLTWLYCHINATRAYLR